MEEQWFGGQGGLLGRRSSGQSTWAQRLGRRKAAVSTENSCRARHQAGRRLLGTLRWQMKTERLWHSEC